jgi:hypothetical protein
MDSEISALRSGLGSVEAEVHALRRDLNGVLDMTLGKTLQTIRTPAGVEGFNFTWEVIAQQIGAEEVEVVAGGGMAGAFFTMYVGGDDHTYLQGGTIVGGNGGSVTIDDYKVLSALTGVGTLGGKVLYLKAGVTATVEDGIMLPGCELTSAVLEYAENVPANDALTATPPSSGFIYYEIGRWTDDEFLPAGAGNLLASGCIGNFHISRA